MVQCRGRCGLVRRLCGSCSASCLTAGPAQATPLAPTAEPLRAATSRAVTATRTTHAAHRLAGAAGRWARGACPRRQRAGHGLRGRSKERPGEWGITTEPGGVTRARSTSAMRGGRSTQPGRRRSCTSRSRASRDGHDASPSSSTATGGSGTTASARSRVDDRRRADVPRRRATTSRSCVQRWTTGDRRGTGCATAGRSRRDGHDPEVRPRARSTRGRSPAGCPAPPGSRSRRPFGEVALNLGALMEDAFGDQCFAFASIWMHSRSANRRPPTRRTTSRRARERADLRRVRNEVLRSRRRWRPRRGRAGHPALPDLGRLRQRRRARPGSRSRSPTKTGDYVIDDIRPPSGTLQAARESSRPGAGRTTGRCCVPARTPDRAGRPLRLRLGADRRADEPNAPAATSATGIPPG